RESQRLEVLDRQGLGELKAERSPAQMCEGQQGDPATLLAYVMKKTGWHPRKTEPDKWKLWSELYAPAAAHAGREGFVGFFEGTWEGSGGMAIALSQGIWKISTDPEARQAFLEVTHQLGEQF